MQSNKFSRAIFIGSAVTLLAAPVWSQEVPGERKQPDRNLTRPSEGEENIPGVRGQGTPESFMTTWNDRSFDDDHLWFTLEVRYVDGTECGEDARWTLVVNGNPDG